LDLPPTRSITKHQFAQQYVTRPGRILPRKYTGMPRITSRRLTLPSSAPPDAAMKSPFPPPDCIAVGGIYVKLNANDLHLK